MRNIFLLFVSLFLIFGTAYAQVNINSASQSELEMLKGIGPAKAKAIIEYREKNGDFESVDDLKKVNGVGSGTIKRLGNNIVVDAGSGSPSIVAMTDRALCQHRGQC